MTSPSKHTAIAKTLQPHLHFKQSFRSCLVTLAKASQVPRRRRVLQPSKILHPNFLQTNQQSSPTLHSPTSSINDKICQADLNPHTRQTNYIPSHCCIRLTPTHRVPALVSYIHDVNWSPKTHRNSESLRIIPGSRPPRAQHAASHVKYNPEPQPTPPTQPTRTWSNVEPISHIQAYPTHLFPCASRIGTQFDVRACPAVFSELPSSRALHVLFSLSFSRNNIRIRRAQRRFARSTALRVSQQRIQAY